MKVILINGLMKENNNKIFPTSTKNTAKKIHVTIFPVLSTKNPKIGHAKVAIVKGIEFSWLDLSADLLKISSKKILKDLIKLFLYQI